MSQTIAVIGLGYVGLPLAAAFGMKRRVIGFDINTTRVQQLRDGVDVTQEVSSEELAEVSQLSFTTELEDLRECSVFIITVPTPIDQFNFQGQLYSRGRSRQGD